MTDDGLYRWPTLRSKLRPVAVIRIPFMWPWIAFDWGPNPYHGNYWRLDFGPWMLFGGSVEFDA